MAKIPDQAEHQRRFAGLETIERRAIIKAVNRGTAVENRKHAPLAVGVARRQQRFWRVAWLLGPVVAVIGGIGGGEFIPALVNAAVATVVLAAMSRFWYRRAARAEAINLELALNRGRGRDRPSADVDTRSAGQRFRSHLPGGSSRPAGSSAGGNAASEAGNDQAAGPAGVDGAETATREREEPGTNPPPGQRPYRPRGRKRR